MGFPSVLPVPHVECYVGHLVSWALSAEKDFVKAGLEGRAGDILDQEILA